MTRKMSIDLYIAAFGITILIFLIGIYFGNELSKSTSSQLLADIQKTAHTSLSLELLLLSEPSKDFCPAFISELNRIDKNTEEIGYKLSYLEEVKKVTDPELKKEYFYLELNSYMLSKKINKICSLDSNFILYFYSTKNCKECKEQGKELLKLKDKYGNKLRIYSFDGNMKSAVVESFKNKYTITSYPFIVVNKKTITGFRNEKELLNVLSK